MTHGARDILTNYDENGYVVALSFQIDLNGRKIGFKLPSDWRPVLKVMEQNSDRDRRGNLCLPRTKRTKDQAIKVAWRILKDWTEAQMALVEIRMVQIEQVFLPYAVTKDGSTVYENFANNPGNLLEGGV